MRPLLVLAMASSTCLVACGASESGDTVDPELATDGSSGGGPADAGAAAGRGGRSPEAAGGAGGECAGARVEVRQIADGTIESGTDVELDRVIATSQKFLVARGSAGSCLWGVFVSAQLGSAATHSGVMVVAYGDSSQPRANGELAACAPGTDAIPDDVTIGDLLSIRGKTEV